MKKLRSFLFAAATLPLLAVMASCGHSAPPAAQSEAASTLPAEPAKAMAEKRVKFNFDNAALDDILDFLADSYGFLLVKDEGTGRLAYDDITVNCPHDVTAGEALDAMNAVLKPHNLWLLKSDKILRLMILDTAKVPPTPPRPPRNWDTLDPFNKHRTWPILGAAPVP